MHSDATQEEIQEAVVAEAVAVVEEVLQHLPVSEDRTPRKTQLSKQPTLKPWELYPKSFLATVLAQTTSSKKSKLTSDSTTTSQDSTPR